MRYLSQIMAVVKKSVVKSDISLRKTESFLLCDLKYLSD